MSRLPIIVGFGGISPAGRSSSHLAFRRMILDRLPTEEANRTVLELALMMGLAHCQDGVYKTAAGQVFRPEESMSLLGEGVKQGTLVRRIEDNIFDPDHVPLHQRVKAEGQDIAFYMPKKELPEVLPPQWQVSEDPQNSKRVQVRVQGELSMLVEDSKQLTVQSAGQLPQGFDAGALYSSTHHPKALKMTIYGASDAVQSLGIDWSEISRRIPPDQVGVYASASMGQLCENGIKGYMQAPLLGKRTSTKQLPLGFAEMPADFINAYVLGSVGHTGGLIGACASFLYNMDAAVKDIQAGRRRVALVGNTEAPLVWEVFEGYRVMGALAEDHQLLELDRAKGATKADNRKACRPFTENCGFTLAESAQFFILMDDELALEMGAQIHGSMGESFIVSDGIKKSISAPGIGNYVTLAKAAASAKAILGEEGLRQRTFVHAHGTGTPQNRVTESHCLNETAKAFGIQNWPIGAIKAYLGHPIGTAAGDQLMAALGTFATGILPGIWTCEQPAADVHKSNLNISKEHKDVQMDACLINTKGFGGNNATGLVLSPEVTKRMLTKKHGVSALKDWEARNQAVAQACRKREQELLQGDLTPLYLFGEGTLVGEDLTITDQEVQIPGFEQPVSLDLASPYPDMSL